MSKYVFTHFILRLQLLMGGNMKMAHKTFITYKYSDVVEGRENNNLRDRIINKLGDAAQYYKGENGYSKDLSSYTAQYIKSYLKDKIYDTSVTIVILSPNMKQSDWMEWEIQYALRNQPRHDRTSRPNGIVAVVQKRNSYGFTSDGYSWFKDWRGEWDLSRTFDIIKDNRNNKKFNAPYYLSNNYIDIVTEDAFLRNPDKYIEDAFYKGQYIEYYK